MTPNPKAPKITLTLLERTLVFNGVKLAGELPDLNGNLPLPPSEPMPVRRRVSVEEFEADMKTARAVLDKLGRGK